MLNLFFQRMLISESKPGLLELFGKVLVELIDSFNLGLEIGVGGEDLYKRYNKDVRACIRIRFW
jgi:hypothetical protein